MYIGIFFVFRTQLSNCFLSTLCVQQNLMHNFLLARFWERVLYKLRLTFFIFKIQMIMIVYNFKNQKILHNFELLLNFKQLRFIKKIKHTLIMQITIFFAVSSFSKYSTVISGFVIFSHSLL